MKRKGICFVCGCVHDDPCDEGCGWANTKQTLCTACEPLSAADREAKRAEQLDYLDQLYQQALDESEFIALRREVLMSNQKPASKPTTRGRGAWK